MKKIAVGTKIRFTKTMIGRPTEDRPACVYGVIGELGTIVDGPPCKEGYWAESDSLQGAHFGIERSEFEPIEP